MPKNKKIAIIQNEFSSLGVEEDLILKDNEEFGEILELPNGCVCCSVKTSFIVAIEQLVLKQKFDYIIVECSGLADPGPLATMFWVDSEELESPVYLDSIISVCDSTTILSDLYENKQQHSAQVIEQLAYADLILLNKMDKYRKKSSSNNTLPQIDHILNQINSSAKIVKTIHSQVNINEILNIRAFNKEGTDLLLKKYEINFK